MSHAAVKRAVLSSFLSVSVGAGGIESEKQSRIQRSNSEETSRGGNAQKTQRSIVNS